MEIHLGSEGKYGVKMPTIQEIDACLVTTVSHYNSQRTRLLHDNYHRGPK